MSKYAFLSKLPHKNTNISSTPPPQMLYTQDTVNPKIVTPKVQDIFVSIPPPLEVIYIVHQLARLTIMANGLLQLSLAHSSFIRFTPRNSNFFLFHMPVIMLNHLFRLPQTKSQIYSNRSFWTP